MMKIVKIKLSQLKGLINEQIDPVGAVNLGKKIYDLARNKSNSQQSQQNKPLPFSEKNLAQELKKQGVMYPEVALAQSMLETGYFKSPIFLDNNNLFGMKHPKQRPTTSKGKNRGHASFTNWQDSVKDYKMWQDYNHLSNLSKTDYINKLNRIYCIPPSCGQSNYAQKIKSLLPKALSALA